MTREEKTELVEKYFEKFGRFAHLLYWMDEETMYKLIREAIEKGEPLDYSKLKGPPGAVL